MREVPIALVGCGMISHDHVAGYRALAEAGARALRVAAVVDVDAAAARERAAQIAAFQGSAPAIFAEVAALARAGVAEAADICLPHCFHHPTAIALLEAGLHVLVEKPIGITARATRAIAAAAQRAGRIAATAENTRRHVGARAAVWAVRAGLIGTPLSATTVIAGDGSPDIANPTWAWRETRLVNGGGMLIDGGAHWADMAIRLFGEPAEIACATRRLAPTTTVRLPLLGEGTTDAEDWWHAVIRFADGAVASWTASLRLPGSPNTRVSTWHGSEGTLSDVGDWPMHPFESGGRLTRRDGAVEPRELEARYLASLGDAERERLFPHGVRHSFAIELWDFARAVAEGGRPEMDAHDGLRAKALCLACYESAARGGAPVAYRDVLEGRVDEYQRPIDQRWGLLGTSAAAG